MLNAVNDGEPHISLLQVGSPACLVLVPCLPCFPWMSSGCPVYEGFGHGCPGDIIFMHEQSRHNQAVQPRDWTHHYFTPGDSDKCASCAGSTNAMSFGVADG